MIRTKNVVSALVVFGIFSVVLVLAACGTDGGVAAPDGGTTAPAPTATTAPLPTATETSRPAVVVVVTVVTQQQPDSGSTSTPNPSMPESTPAPTPIPPVRRVPTESFTVHDLDVEPLVGTVFETLLSKMPDNEVTRAYTRMGDAAGVLERLGLTANTPGEPIEDYFSKITSLETDGFYPPIWQWPAEARDYVSIHDWYPDLAFDHGTMEQFAHTNSQFRFFGGERPFTSYDVALGDFSGSATLAAIAACDCEQPEIREYSGVEYYAWGEGDGIGEVRERHKRPMFDHIGRGPHLLVLDGEAYYSIRDGVIDEHIDVIQGKKSSLADVEDIVTAVQLVSSLGPTSEIVVRDFGFTLKQTFEGLRGQESEEEIVGGVPLLLPTELVVTSVGYDGNRMFTGLAIVHDSSSSAEENVERLLARLEVVVSTNYVAKSERTWAYLTDRIEIQTSDRFLIARLYFTERGTARLLEFSNNLLVQEDQNDGRRRDD